ncbi:MAG: MotA/TolQ/ExbB proton channel family protein [Candidatus Eisenbacteria bacterium]|nr:MotA/TolQ/ExbB proton channel family protein [Candidatus Eisenbacteria bacterium]
MRIRIGWTAAAAIALGAAPASAEETGARMLRFAAEAFAGPAAPFLIAAALVGVLAGALAAERIGYLYFRAVRGDLDAFHHIIRLIKDQRIEEARSVADRSDTPFGRIARSLLRIHHGHRSEELQNLLDEAYLREVPKVHRRIPLLAVGANTATLIGLLGTIVGLVLAFEGAAESPVEARAAALASGIAAAMAATGAGLLVAIPALLAHGLLGARADRVVEEIEARIAVLTNLLHLWNRAEQADPFDDEKTGIAERGERLVDFVTNGEIR